jgi:hypothetical protein
MTDGDRRTDRTQVKKPKQHVAGQGLKNTFQHHNPEAGKAGAAQDRVR